MSSLTILNLGFILILKKELLKVPKVSYMGCILIKVRIYLGI